MTQRRISVVLPVYNEHLNVARCLRGLWDALSDEEHEILVCYDFDEDTTLAAIAAMPDRPTTVRLVKNDLGRGAANALRAGFRAAEGDVVVTTMADLSDPPDRIPLMAERIRAGADVVSGSRYMAGGSQTGGPRLKRAMSQTASYTLQRVAGLATLDATSNFRAYAKSYLERVEIESHAGFEIALELTIKAHLAGGVLDEVPSSWLDRTAGESRFRIWKWLPSYLRWYLRAMAAPLAAWAVLAALLAWSLVRTGDFGARRAIAVLLVAAAAALAGGALVLARTIRGRNVWSDVALPAFWLHSWILPALSAGTWWAALGGGALASLALIAATAGKGRLRRWLPSAGRRIAALSTQRTVGFALLFAMLWATRLQLPNPASTPQLDASWEQAIGYALAHGLQWGRDICFTFGPLGTFSYPRYEPALFWTAIAGWELVFKSVVTVFLVLAVARAHGAVSRTLLYLVLLLPLVGQDAYYFVAVLAITAWILARPAESLARTALGFAVLAAIALVKFTYLVLIAAAVAAVAASVWRRRSILAALGAGAIFTALLVAWWAACGQNPLNLPAYLRSSAWIASGYNEAMSTFGPWSEVRFALAVAILAALAALLHVLQEPRAVERWAFGAVLLAGLFVAGKAGFVRHGDSAITFFTFAAAVPFLLTNAAGARGAERILGSLKTGAAWSTLVLGMIGYHTSVDHGASAPHRLVGDWMAQLAPNVVRLARLDELEPDLVRQRDELRRTFDLPRIRERVGRETIDLIHSRQGLLFLNDLSWKPRPAFQGYFTYAPQLLAANARFLAGPEAPRYLAFAFETSDERLPNMEDAEALVVMMRDYAPVLVEKGTLLLERRPDAPRPALARTSGWSRDVAFGEAVELGELDGAPWLLRVEIRNTAFGRLMNALAKSPPVWMEVTLARGERGRFRIVPGMLHEGVLVKPALLGQDAWIDWYCGRRQAGWKEFRITASEGGRAWFEPRIHVELVRLEGLVPPADASLADRLSFSMFSTQPKAVVSPLPTRRKTIRGKELLVLQAPSEMRFDLAPGSHRLRAEFGIEPLAYREGHTDGAGFRVVARDRDGTERVLFERRLDPFAVAEDRKLQELDVVVDARPGTELLLQTDTGPSGDPTSDLTFWTAVEIARIGDGGAER